jgi:hypothetical protein
MSTKKISKKHSKNLLQKFNEITADADARHVETISFKATTGQRQELNAALRDMGFSSFEVSKLRLGPKNRKCLKYEPVLDEHGNIIELKCVLWE